MIKYLCWLIGTVIVLFGKDQFDELIGSLWMIAAVICWQIEKAAKGRESAR